MNKPTTIAFACCLAIYSASTATAALTVSLSPNTPSPKPVGTSITLTATVSGDTDPSPVYVYEFTAEIAGQPRVKRAGFQRSRTTIWTPSEYEGTYTVDVVVKNTHAGTSASATINYTITSRLGGADSVVNTTANPLVALFSGPACRQPNSMRVRFTPTSVPAGGNAAPMYTGLKGCRFDVNSATPDGSSMNFYIAGMYPSRTYMMRWETLRPDGSAIYEGPELPFNTGAIPATVNLPAFSSVGTSDSPIDRLVLHNAITIPVNGKIYTSSATDLAGNVVWYSTNVHPTRTEFDGSYWGLPPGNDVWNPAVRQVDLAGNTIIETTVGAINEQLAVMGVRPITSIHHDTRRILKYGGGGPDGHILALASNEFVLTSATQCGTETNGNPKTCLVIGDAILVLDRNMNVVWAWDGSAHMDVNQRALLNELCTNPVGSAGCPPFYTPGFTTANDWTHANSLQYTHYDGNIIMSMRHLDAVIKINYADGAGDGRILWQMGNFPLNDSTGNPTPRVALATNNTGGQHDIGYPWFSHQHDSEIEYAGFLFPNGFRVITIFDNGNLREENVNPAAHSRCQLFAINEDQLIANLNTNADVDSYSFAVGTAQMLTNGSVACDSGFIGGFAAAQTNPRTETTESNQAGVLKYKLVAEQDSYRTFRMKSMYAPINP